MAATGGVVLLGLLGIAAPWTDWTTPVHGYLLPSPATAVTGPVPVSPAPPSSPPPGRVEPGAASAGASAGADGPAVPPGPPLGSGRGGGNEPDAPPPPPAAPPAPPSLPALTSVRLSMSGGLSATLYVGQLAEVTGQLAGKVTFNTDRSFRSAYPRLCVTTVVVHGASGTEGAVYAHGLGPGWGGAEGVPDQRVAADNGTLHQQLIFPPSTVRPGQRWTGSASVHIDGTQVGASGDYHLILEAVAGEDWHWRVGNSGATVECQPY